MIQENEIRSGNWFHHDERWSIQNEKCKAHNFQFTGQHFYHISECTFYLEAISPIPLTEEWLLKCNAKRHVGFNRCISFGYTINGKEYRYFHYDHINKIEYVHQLQNLAFIITGQELAIAP